MKCSFCDKKAIYSYKRVFYCKKHFIEHFERKVLDTIKKYGLIEPNEKVGVAVSGGKDSISLLFLLNKYRYHLDIDIVGIHINEGIKGYRDTLTRYLEEFSEKFEIPIKIYTFKEIFGFTLDEAVNIVKSVKPCTICGIWRRWIINKASKDLKVDKLATAHNLNDEAQTVLMNIMDGNLKEMAKGGVYVGMKDFESFVPRIKPFYFVTEKETTIYALLNGINPPWVECKYIRGQIRDVVRAKLYELESRREGICENVVEKYIEILPKIKSSFKIPEIKRCEICGEPSSRKICRACEIKNLIIQSMQGA